MERRRKLAAAQLLLIVRRRQALSRKQSVRPVWTKRADESEYITANGDDSLLFKFYRMSPETFDALHDMVRDRLSKEFGYLSSGMLIRDAAMAFRVGLETAREAIHLTCSVLWEVLSPMYMKINLQPENAHNVVKATCILPNFLSMTTNAAATYRPPGYADCHDVFGSVCNGTWPQGTASAAVFGLQGAKVHNSTNVANSVRKVFMNYFKNEGQVAGKWDLPGVTRP
ncbi:hypothetical protein HPB49_013541 [Dermacentor silvarum]|uniref:Uncharacterized protein n=1 Tax=Dermacentor silvarum TaxID=543639 RepID=A0ACB8C9P5_DERSI|nr:hypothetical protein HPB49_013541 [Dermacentor silvarum]